MAIAIVVRFDYMPNITFLRRERFDTPLTAYEFLLSLKREYQREQEGCSVPLPSASGEVIGTTHFKWKEEFQ